MQFKNPVMFIVEVGSLLTTIVWIQELAAGTGNPLFTGQVAFWLWFTVLFANFAEAMAEGRGKAQAATLRKAKTETTAVRVLPGGQRETVNASSLRAGDVVRVEAGQMIPGDGEIIEGVASVDESAITGESAPVIREAGGDRSAVTGGTKVLSDWIVVKITSNPGETFLDRMIALVEGAVRQKTPNEIALNILLAVLTLVFLLVVVTLEPFANYAGTSIPIPVLIALLVCLIPTTIGALISAIGIAGMDRLVQQNVLAMSGRAVEAAGDVDTLLLDKTGTITLGNRQATAFRPAPGVSDATLADAAQLASLADETPEGRSIVVLAKEKVRSARARSSRLTRRCSFRSRRTRACRASTSTAAGSARAPSMPSSGSFRQAGNTLPAELRNQVDRISREGGTPLAVAENGRALGVIHLKDIVKGGIRDRFAHLRAMGIKTVMITGDNPLTAAAIAAEAGVDDFMAEATPEEKLKLIRSRAGRRPHGGDDRRRHQRRPGAGSGGRGCGDEHRHDGRQGSRQHGRPRLEPDQADRDRRNRQAAADDPRRADDVLDRQRRREVLRDHPGDVHPGVPAAWRAEHHGTGDAGVGDPVGRDLQRRDHHRADSARAPRRSPTSRSARRRSCAGIF